MKIGLGDRVTRLDPKDNRIGEVIEVGENDRIRVLWDGDPKARYNYDRPKRTWLKSCALLVIVKNDE